MSQSGRLCTVHSAPQRNPGVLSGQTAVRFCLLAALALYAITGCRPSESSMPSQPIAQKADSLSLTPAPEPSLPQCPKIEFAPVSADAFGPRRAIGLYVRVQSETESYDVPLAPLVDLTGETPWATVDGPTQSDTLDAVEELQMQMFYTYTPGYRVGATCGRLAIHNDYEVRDIEAFVAPGDHGRLVLLDSLGQYMLTLGASETAELEDPAAGEFRRPDEDSGAVVFDPSGPSLRTASGRLSLAEVLPYGRWYARPAGVGIGQSDLVLVHTCDLSNPSDQPCGFETDDDGRALADPYFPFVTHLGVKTSSDGRTLEITPYAVAWQDSVFDVDPAGQSVGRPLSFTVSDP